MVENESFERKKEKAADLKSKSKEATKEVQE